MSFCANCGAQLTPEVRFCPKCGKPAPQIDQAETPAAPPAVAAPVIPPPVVPPPPAVAPPPPAAAAAPPRTGPIHVQSPPRTAATTSGYTPSATPPKRSTWWIVPAVIVGLVVIAWLLLAGLPFGGREEGRIAENTATTDTIAEGTTTRNEPLTGTVIEVPGGDMTLTGTTDTALPPDADTTDTIAAAGTPQPSTQPQPRVIDEPAGTPPAPAPARTTPAPARTTPTPARTTPAPARPAPAPVRTTPVPAPVRTVPAPVRTPPAAPPPARPTGEISDAEAAATLRSYITSNSYYEGVTADCVQVRSQGYRNVGYTYSVWDGCVSGGGSRMLGRWRVDSKTREVFRQQGDGRFLRP